MHDDDSQMRRRFRGVLDAWARSMERDNPKLSRERARLPPPPSEGTFRFSEGGHTSEWVPYDAPAGAAYEAWLDLKRRVAEDRDA